MVSAQSGFCNFMPSPCVYLNRLAILWEDTSVVPGTEGVRLVPQLNGWSPGAWISVEMSPPTLGTARTFVSVRVAKMGPLGVDRTVFLLEALWEIRSLPSPAPGGTCLPSSHLLPLDLDLPLPAPVSRLRLHWAIHRAQETL